MRCTRRWRNEATTIMTARADCSSRSGVAVWLAGTIGLDAYGAMAERLAWEVSEPHGRPPTLLLYDLAPSITIGRLGSRADIALTDDDLRSRGLEVRFVGRGGGAVLHGPGQIGISVFASLADLGLGRDAVGAYLERLESGLEGAIRSLRCGAARDSRMHGIFGRTGLLAAVGVAVRRGVVWHGGFLNIQPPLELHRRIKSVPVAAGAGTHTMGSVEADVQRRVRLQDARAALVEHLVDAFEFPQSHIQSGFPFPVQDAVSAASERKRSVE
jgi:lipoyl(octanoyl) transferase